MTGRIIPFQALRIGLASFAIAAAALVGWQQLSAQGLGGHNSNAPVNYAADRIELQDRQDRVVLSGNVDITQDNLRLRAGRTTVAFSDAGTLRINRITATGGVTVTRGGESARGNVAIYDLNDRVITLVGNVRLQRSGDTLSGGRLVIDLQSGVSSVDGRASGNAAGTRNSGGRVSGSFRVPDQN
ncbi:hypothetical protein GCM10011371_16330 [Novosphingobium marinum]|uniref:Lipopolysaccharide export system protein LptA n=1 Tax=Novosphingobium marinum TaxID=1514948 RepID=A0A7Y9XZD7_9SPHN|nr:LptA/OstA family protein [Novosphingobium marinum]NYH95746.1 lipopolysaccharide export system protein LptA [Novosphingobium marinum]GGC29546.1 hypothetical protein GCM10011371_16330 [Novosphingobium marinum]